MSDWTSWVCKTGRFCASFHCPGVWTDLEEKDTGEFTAVGRQPRERASQPAGLGPGCALGIGMEHAELCVVCCPQPCPTPLCLSLRSTSRATWRTDRDMGLMNAIGLQPRNPTTSVTSQGTQTLALQLQNAETQTEREIQEPGTAASGPGEGRSHVTLEGK